MIEKIKLQDVKEEKTSFKRELLKFIILTIPAATIAFNINTFVHTGNLIPGGFSGITILLQYICRSFLNFELPYSLVYLPLNLVPIIIAFKHIGKKFTIYSLYVIVVQSILTDIIPSNPITDDMLLIAVFGGIINGTSIAILLYSGACSGGLDFISIFFAEKKGINTWNYVLGFNACLIIICGLIFGFDYALYSIIFQFVSTQVLNFTDRRLQKSTVLIVTENPDDVSAVINNVTLHASTVIDATGSYLGQRKYIVYSVVGRNQTQKITLEIKKVDPNAFVNVLRTDRLTGNFYMTPRA